MLPNRPIPEIIGDRTPLDNAPPAGLSESAEKIHTPSVSGFDSPVCR